MLTFSSTKWVTPCAGPAKPHTSHPFVRDGVWIVGGWGIVGEGKGAGMIGMFSQFIVSSVAEM